MIQTGEGGREASAGAGGDRAPDALAAAQAIFHFGERDRRAAEAAFRRDAADIPVGAAAARAIIGLVLPVDGIVAPLGGIVREIFAPPLNHRSQHLAAPCRWRNTNRRPIQTMPALSCHHDLSGRPTAVLMVDRKLTA